MYPVNFQTEYGNGTRSRGLAVTGVIFFLKVLLVIPHFIVLWFLYIAAAVATYIGYWIVAITGRMPEGLYDFLRNVIAWYHRVGAWILGLTDEYPPFALESLDYPAQMTDSYGDGTRSRGLAVTGVIFFLKSLLALPHFIVVGVLQFVATVVAYIGFWIVAFTGKLPEGIHNLLGGYLRWSVRVNAWLAGLEDTYPPFSLE